MITSIHSYAQIQFSVENYRTSRRHNSASSIIVTRVHDSIPTGNPSRNENIVKKTAAI